MNQKQHHGIYFPLSALRNPNGSGIGEYLDLIPMLHWCHATGFDVIQLLPLNDSGQEPSPYSALSAEALHPIYLSLSDLPFLERMPHAQDKLSLLKKNNTLQRFNYHQVLQDKKCFLREYFAAVFPYVVELPEYQNFIDKEKDWLDRYVQYKSLKSKNEMKPWWEWTNMTPPTEESCNFYRLVQFLAFTQMRKVKQIATELHVFLKGDIPILIDRDSSDVWCHQQLFQLEYAAGAPPDVYSHEGQYWGFPIYNWAAHEASHFSWWKERLRVASELYHLYRIDHIVGFFRIWAIPIGHKAVDGFFIPSNPTTWIEQGEKILKMFLMEAPIQPIGEDLGMVPDEVRASLERLHIPGTKVYRWERKWKEDRGYIPVENYPPHSMSTVSTHDSEVLGEWWKKGGEEVIAFCRHKGWEYDPLLSYEYRLAILQDIHRSASIFHINLLQEYLNLFPELSWNSPDEERINIPGKVLDRNWSYRFRPTIAEIINFEPLTHIMQQLSGCFSRS